MTSINARTAIVLDKPMTNYEHHGIVVDIVYRGDTAWGAEKLEVLFSDGWVETFILED